MDEWFRIFAMMQQTDNPEEMGRKDNQAGEEAEPKPEAHLHCRQAAAVLEGGQAGDCGLPHNLVAAVANHQVDDG